MSTRKDREGRLKAAVLIGQGTFAVDDVPMPSADPGYVVLRVKYCGICGSDLHAAISGQLPTNTIMGHEFAGEIVRIGQGVEGWKVGDHVTSIPMMPCGQCEACQRQAYFECAFLLLATIGLGQIPGAFAQYVRVHPAMLFSIPPGVGFREAALNEPLAVAVHAVRIAQITADTRVAIIGAGPIGLLALQCAKEAGTSAIYVIESAAARAAVAAELGADKVIDPNQSDVLNEILQLTGRGADVVLECAGAPNTLQQAIDMVKPGGRVILVGVSPEPVEIVPLILIAKQVSVQGLLGYEADDFRQAMRLLEQGKIDATRLVTDIVPLDGVQEAFQSLANPEKQIKVLVEP